jgi:hypothetical protein
MRYVWMSIRESVVREINVALWLKVAVGAVVPLACLRLGPVFGFRASELGVRVR